MTDAMTRIDQRFDAVDRRFDAVDRRFDAVDRQFERVWDELRDIRRFLAQLGWGIAGVLMVQTIGIFLIALRLA